MQRANVWFDVLVPAGLAAMIVGAWGPWVAHANAGMSLNVSDLVEFVKFMTRAGLTYIVRELFYLPLLAAAVGTALWANLLRPSGSPKDPKGLLLASGSALLTLVALPPYPYLLSAYRSSEDRLSFWMSLGALGLVLAAGVVGRRVPRQVAAGGLIVLAVGSTAPAVWQFARLVPPLAELYGAPVKFGWGLVVTALGSLVLAAGAISELRGS